MIGSVDVHIPEDVNLEVLWTLGLSKGLLSALSKDIRTLLAPGSSNC
jgi:hypothetical protein